MAFILILIIILALLLIGAVLIQSSKGGLASQFTGAGASQLMGVKRTGDLLEQITWGLMIGLIVLTLSTSFVVDKNPSDEGPKSINRERAAEKSTAPINAPQKQNSQPTKDSIKK